MTESCGCIPQDCSVCFSLAASQCPDTINIPCGLTPGNPYYLWVRDHFGNLFSDFVTVGSNGSVDLVAASFPTGMFIEDAVFELFLTTNSDGTGIVTMNFTPTATCVSLNIATTLITDECGNILMTETNQLITE